MFATNRRGERVLRTGQTGDRLVGVVLVIVIAAAIAFVGVDVTSEIDATTSADLPERTPTVTNESFTLTTFSEGPDNSPLYSVSKAGSRDAARFLSTVTVYNVSSGASNDDLLTENTDYNWFPKNGSVEILNTTATQGPSGDANGTYLITYTYEHRQANFVDSQDNVSGGFTSAMSLIDIVFIVLMFSVILGALLMFRART